MIDISSRGIVGAFGRASEARSLAAVMIKETFGIYGTPQVVYANWGRR